jgi:DNA-binding response OmpR family regulator
MAHILYIEGSPRKQRSASIEVARAALAAWRSDSLDVWSTPLPEFDGLAMEAKYAALSGTQLTSEQEAALVGDPLDRKTVEVNGARVHVTGKEYQLLELLALRKGIPLTKEMFLNHLYGGMDEPESKIIDVFICKRCPSKHPNKIQLLIGRSVRWHNRPAS